MECVDEKIVSVIIPLYYGMKYVDSLYLMCTKALEKADILVNSEIIFVNDSPDEVVCIDGKDYAKLVVNDHNEGIHASKINGLNHACGKYIHFLDQDDLIELDFYKNQICAIEEADIIICNAIMEHSNYERKLYRSKVSLNMVLNPLWYIYIDNRVESLGQCVIRRRSIPSEWTETKVRVNGADDYYLLLAMFEKKRKYKVNPDVLYRHVYTEKNLSLDIDNMKKSVLCVAELMKEKFADERLTKLLQRRVLYLNGRKDIITLPFIVFNNARKVSRKLRG